MEKPTPENGRRGAINFIDMCKYIDEKYGINQRDYAGRYKFSWTGKAEELGLTSEHASKLYQTRPMDMTEEELKIVEQIREAKKAWDEEHPYQDFWHLQVDVIHNFQNDVFLEYPLHDMEECCEYEWQKEIARLWKKEWEEYEDEYGTVFVWISW